VAPIGLGTYRTGGLNVGTDDNDRRIDIILQQQIELSADIEGMDDRFTKITSTMGELASALEKHSEQLGNLADAFMRLTNIVDKQIELSKETDSRLNALAETVEKYIGHRGYIN
jgi:ABC-type transporter Mla subunit MlaD